MQFEEEASDFSDSEERPVFDIDQMSVGSDNKEAIEYLKAVRKEASSGWKNRDFDDSKIILKPTDKKYLAKSQNLQLMQQQRGLDPAWQEECLKQFHSMRNNIEGMRAFKQSTEQLQYERAMVNMDAETETRLSGMLENQAAFLENVDQIIPTLNFMISIDYSASTRIVHWLAQLKSLSRNALFWTYCVLTQLEDPLDGDQISDINQILKACLRQRTASDPFTEEDGANSVVITVIQKQFKQRFIE